MEIIDYIIAFRLNNIVVKSKYLQFFLKFVHWV